MEPATIAAIGTVLTTVGPLLIKCGEMVFKRYVPEIAADVIKDGCAAQGKKALGGGDGMLGRVGEGAGRAFGWLAGLFVADKVRPLVNEGAEALSAQAAQYFLGKAADVATNAVGTYVAKKIEASVAEEKSDVDEKMKQQMLLHMTAKAQNAQAKGEILQAKLERQRMKTEQMRAEVELADEKRRRERENWKLEPVVAQPTVVLDTVINGLVTAAAA